MDDHGKNCHLNFGNDKNQVTFFYMAASGPLHLVLLFFFLFIKLDQNNSNFYHIYHFTMFLLLTMFLLQFSVMFGSLENSQGNFYDGASFSKAISLQVSGCNFSIKRIHHRLSLENLPKASCLKKQNSLF